MQIQIDLTTEQAERLQNVAKNFGIKPGEFAQAAFLDLLNRPSQDFLEAANHIVRKNEELYRRLG